jgi:NCAIR mutase (PurE)-related protein
MNQDRLQDLLTQVQRGAIEVPDALQQLRILPYENLGFASLDHHRALRQGFPEVIFCEGKTERQVVAIARTLLRTNDSLLATRVERPVARALLRVSKQATYHEAARVVAIAPPKLVRRGSVLIVTAGTADIPVAEEARVTADIMGSRTETLYDVGVAGLHRLLGQQERLHEARALVVVAGMDGVLPSVVGGIVRQPVIAVPTSRGYGAHFGGLSALLTMLNSCAAGVGVMNIDNGFGAGCLAHRINMVGEAEREGRRGRRI